MNCTYFFPSGGNINGIVLLVSVSTCLFLEMWFICACWSCILWPYQIHLLILLFAFLKKVLFFKINNNFSANRSSFIFFSFRCMTIFLVFLQWVKLLVLLAKMLNKSNESGHLPYFWFKGESIQIFVIMMFRFFVVSLYCLKVYMSISMAFLFLISLISVVFFTIFFLLLALDLFC